MCLSKRGRSCQLCVLCDAKSAFDQGNTIAKMISRQKQKKHSMCAKENRRIQQVVLADVRVLGKVASLRCVSCASSFCFNILLRLDMTHADLSPSPAPSLSLMPAQGALYFRCTGHQVFWGKVRRSAQEAPCTRAFPSFTRSFFKFLIQIFERTNFFSSPHTASPPFPPFPGERGMKQCVKQHRFWTSPTNN